MPPAVAAPPPTPVEPVTETHTEWRSQIPIAGWKTRTRPEHGHGSKNRQGIRVHTWMRFPGSRANQRTGSRAPLAFKEVISEPWNLGDRYFFLKRQEGTESRHSDAKRVIRRGDSPGPTQHARNRDFDCRFYYSRSLMMLGSSPILCDKAAPIHSSLEILDLERNTVLTDRLPEGFCTGFVFGPDGTQGSTTLIAICAIRGLTIRRPSGIASAVTGRKDIEVFFAGEEPNLFLGILDSPEANLLAYAVFSAGSDRPPRSTCTAWSGSCSQALVTRYRRLLCAVLRTGPTVRLHRLRRSELSDRRY